MSTVLASQAIELGMEVYFGKIVAVAAAACHRIHPPYRSPGHQCDGGSLAEIFLACSATKRLRLKG